MKYSIKTLLIVLGLFLVAQYVGLYVNSIYFANSLPYGLTPPQVEAEASPWFFVSTLIIVTTIFLLLRKFNLKLLMKFWFITAFVMTISITLSAVIESWIAFIVAIALVILRIKEHDLVIHNLTEILVYGGVVAIFAPILNIWSAIILLGLISIYDFIAVNITKHMVGLAKMQGDLGIFSGLVVQNKNESAILGGGDIAFTLLFATVALREFGFISAMFVIYGATLGILALMLLGKKKKFYPAMPFVTIGSLLGFLITII